MTRLVEWIRVAGRWLRHMFAFVATPTPIVLPSAGKSVVLPKIERPGGNLEVPNLPVPPGVH
jgi:hypothetical protein